MLMKTYHLAFFSFLMLGTIVACSANSWFTCWLGLEINLMSLIPLLINKLTPLSTETAIKYFMAQAMASLIIIFASLTDMMSMLNNTIAHQNEIILIALCISAGMAPFHFWFPQVMKIAEWAQCTLILTWQKVAPFILISYLTSSKITYAVILISALVGSTGGLNQMALKLVLTYSSIAHSAWMLALCSSSSLSSWMTYFLIYCSISISVIVVLYKTNVTMLQQILVNKWSTSMKSTFMLSIMSLGGLPPLLGFIAKLNAIQLIFNPLGFALISTLIMSSLLSLFYYTRLMYSALLKISQTTAVSPMMTCSVPPSVMVISTAGNVIAPLFILLT